MRPLFVGLAVSALTSPVSLTGRWGGACLYVQGVEQNGHWPHVEPSPKNPSPQKPSSKKPDPKKHGKQQPSSKKPGAKPKAPGPKGPRPKKPSPEQQGPGPKSPRPKKVVPKRQAHEEVEVDLGGTTSKLHAAASDATTGAEQSAGSSCSASAAAAAAGVQGGAAAGEAAAGAGAKREGAVVNIVFATVWDTDLAKAVGPMKALAKKAGVKVWLLYHRDLAGAGPKSKDLREAGVNLLQFTGDITLWEDQQKKGIDESHQMWIHTTSFSDSSTVPLYLAKSVKKALGPPIPPEVFEMSSEMMSWTDKQVDTVIGEVDFWISDYLSPFGLYATRKFNPMTTAMAVWHGNDGTFRSHPGQDKFSTGVLFLWFGAEIFKGAQDYMHFVPTLTANLNGDLGDLRRDEELSATRFGGGTFLFPHYPQNLPVLPKESIHPVPDIAQNTACAAEACLQLDMDWNIVKRKSDCCSFRELAFCAAGHRYVAGKAGCGDSSKNNPYMATMYADSGFHLHSTCCVRDGRYPAGSAGDPERQALMEARAPRVVPYRYVPGGGAAGASGRDGAVTWNTWLTDLAGAWTGGPCREAWVRDVAARAGGRTVVYVSLGTAARLHVSWENLEYMAADLKWLSPDQFYIVFRLNFHVGSFSADKKAALERHHPNFRVEPAFVPESVLFSCQKKLVFVSHCGMGSALEALAVGHPLVATPMHGDQLGNAQTLTQLGLAFDASPFYWEMIYQAPQQNRLWRGVLHWSNEQNVRKYAENRQKLRDHLEQNAFDDERLADLALHVARTKMNWTNALQLDADEK